MCLSDSACIIMRAFERPAPSSVSYGGCRGHIDSIDAFHSSHVSKYSFVEGCPSRASTTDKGGTYTPDKAGDTLQVSKQGIITIILTIIIIVIIIITTTITMFTKYY